MEQHCAVSFILLSLLLASFPEAGSGADYQHTIYIDPSTGQDSSECLTSNSPSSPCANLTWVFQNSRQNSTNYVLSQGSHVLTESTPQFKDCKHLAFTGNSSLVTCIHTGLAFVNVENIAFQDITFSGCAALRNSTSKNFADNTIREFMVGLYFYLCESISMSGVSVSHSPNATGVVIYNTNGTNTFSDSRFTDNKVTVISKEHVGGGGVYVEFTYCAPGVLSCDIPISERNKDASFTFTSCVFSNNQADNGDEFLTSTFVIPYHSDHITFGNGGGLSLFVKGTASNVSFTAVDCVFRDNIALWGGGVYVNFQDGSHSNVMNVSRCEFSNNFCPYSLLEGMNGGGMSIGHYVYGMKDPLPDSAVGNTVTVEHCTFTNNSALHGGGLGISLAYQQASQGQLAFIHLLNSTFEDNVAKLGSAINFDRFSSISRGFLGDIQVEDCSFNFNNFDYAENIGKGDRPYQTGIGAVHVDEVPVWFKGNITFYANSGSALSVIGTIVNFTHCHAHFANNTGNTGAAIALLGAAYIQISHGTWMAFEHNIALSRGGAIYNTYISRENLKSDSNCFIRHTDPFLHPDNWNVTFIFAFNKDIGGTHSNSIHSTSILPCLVPGGSGLTNSTKQIFCWNNWVYGNQFVYCNAEVTSDIGNMTFLENRYISVYPGWTFSLPIALEDDLEHTIDEASFEVTYNDTNEVNAYRGDSVVVDGKPDTSVQIYVNSFGNRIWHFDLTVDLKPCPAGFSSKTPATNISGLPICTCSDTYGGTVLCDAASKTVQLLNGMWLGTLPKKGNHSDPEADADFFVVMDCPLHFCEKTNEKYINETYKNDPNIVTDWDKKVCGPTNRTGINCGECIEGFGPAVNSLTYDCVNCTDINLAANVMIYIASAYLPLAVLFTILIVFDVRLTTGPANAFILYCQVVTSTFDLNADGGIPVKNNADKVLRYAYHVPFGIFNLKFIENYIHPICFSTQFNMLSVFLLEYAVAIFPLFMIIIALICLQISENCCKNLGPEHRRRLLSISRLASVLSTRNKKKKFNDALLPAFASFLLLSYNKFSTTSSYILTSQLPVNESGYSVPPARVYYASQFAVTDSSYLAYKIPALLVFATIVAVTPLILLDYPLKALEWCIMKVACLKRIYPNDKIHLFLNMFQGCYRTKMRFFAGLYFLFRLVINVSYILTATWLQQFLVQQAATTIMIAFLAMCQPYEWNLLNYVDIAIFTNMAILNAIGFYLYSYIKIDPLLSPPDSTIAIQYVLVFLPLVYMAAYVSWNVTRSYHPKIIGAFKKFIPKKNSYEPLATTPPEESDGSTVPVIMGRPPSRSFVNTREFEDDFEAMLSRAEDQNTYTPSWSKSVSVVEVSGRHSHGEANTFQTATGSDDSGSGKDSPGGQFYGAIRRANASIN